MEIKRSYWVKPGWHVAICMSCPAAAGFKTYGNCFTYGYRHFTEYGHKMQMYIGINNPVVEVEGELPPVTRSNYVTEQDRKIIEKGFGNGLTT